MQIQLDPAGLTVFLATWLDNGCVVYQRHAMLVRVLCSKALLQLLLLACGRLLLELLHVPFCCPDMSCKAGLRHLNSQDDVTDLSMVHSDYSAFAVIVPGFRFLTIGRRARLADNCTRSAE